MFGLYHQIKDHWSFKAYCIFIILLHWFSFSKTIFVFNFTQGGTDVLNAETTLKIIFTGWTFCFSFATTLFYCIQTNESKLIKFGNIWQEIFEEFQEDEEKEIKIIKKIVFISIMIFLGIGISQSIFFTLTVFGPQSFQTGALNDFILAPYQNASWVQTSVPFKLFFLVIAVDSVSFVFYLAYYFNYCYLSIRVLKLFKKKFKEFVLINRVVLKNKNEIEGEKALNEFYKWHIELTSLLRCLNDCFKEFIASAVVFFIVGTFILIWMTVTWSSTCITGINIVIIPFWLVFMISIMLVILLPAVTLHVEVINF